MFHPSGSFIFAGYALSPECSLGTRWQIDRTLYLATPEFEVRSVADVTGCDLTALASFEVIWDYDHCASIVKFS